MWKILQTSQFAVKYRVSETDQVRKMLQCLEYHRGWRHTIEKLSRPYIQHLAIQAVCGILPAVGLQDDECSDLEDDFVKDAS
jgi:hypothetical protein